MFFTIEEIQKWKIDSDGFSCGPNNVKIWIAQSAIISKSARIGKSASIGEGAGFNITPLYILGTKHIVNIYSHTKIAIGCEIHNVVWWREHYKEVGEKNGYNKQQIQEYQWYIEICSEWLRYQKEIGALKTKKEQP